MDLYGDSIGDTRTVWDCHFTWTADHPTIAELHPLLHSYDTLATEALERLDELEPPTSKVKKGCPGHRDLYALVQKYADKDEVVGKLWKEVTTVPEWVDWEQIARGQRVVYQYNAQMLLGLLCRSLVGGMGAGRVVETLARTGGFGVEVTRRRLLETFQHFMEVCEDLAAVQPGGKGHVSSVRVRLLHGTVRRRIMRLARERPGYFDLDAWGVPINDLHTIATVSVYSAALAHQALPRAGVELSQQELADYFALWRWIGYVMGTPVHWMDTPARARAWMESVMASEIHPTPGKSPALANNILTAEANVPPLFAARELLAAHAWRMNGPNLSRVLEIEEPGMYYRVMSALQYGVFWYSSYTYPYLPAFLRRRRDKHFLEFAQRMITDRKIGGLGKLSTFHFQYEPSADKTTTELGPTSLPGVRRGTGWATLLAVVAGGVLALGSLALVLDGSGVAARREVAASLLLWPARAISHAA